MPSSAPPLDLSAEPNQVHYQANLRLRSHDRSTRPRHFPWGKSRPRPWGEHNTLLVFTS